MKTINNLSSTDSLSLGDLLALWSTNNGGTRKVSINTLIDFIKGQGGESGLTSLLTFDNLRDLDTSLPETLSIYLVEGKNTVNDGFGGIYYWDALSTQADDDFLVIDSSQPGDGRWIRLEMNNIIVVDTVIAMNNLNINVLGDTKSVFVKENGALYVYESSSWVNKSLTSSVLTVSTISNLPSSASNGDTTIVKDLTRGGTFIYDSTKSAINDKGTIINGWVRDYDEARYEWFEDKASAMSFVNTNSKKLIITSSITINIPSDISDFQKALDYIIPDNNNIEITLNIDSTHQLTKGFRVQDGDFSQFTITSTDAIVQLSNTFIPVSNTDLDAGVPRTAQIGFLAIRAKMPKIATVIDLSNYTSLVTGYELDHGSDGIIKPACGFINIAGTGTNARVSTSSRLHSYQSNFSGSVAGVGLSVTVNSHVSAAEGNFTNCGETGLDVSRGSVVYANSADFSGCKEGVYVRRSWLSCQLSDFSNCTSVGIYATLGSRVTSQGSIFDGAIKDIQITDGAMVDVSNATKASLPLSPADSVRSNANGGTKVLDYFNAISGGGFITNDDFVSGHSDVVTSSAIVQELGGNVISVAAGAYYTILDLTGEYSVVSGNVYGIDLGLRITIDGVVVLHDLGRNRGQDEAGNHYCVVPIPPCKSKTSLKIEAYNRGGVTNIIGYKLHRISL